jgi:release factor glutamine methyltransferase
MNPTSPNIAQTLTLLQAQGIERLDAQLLLLHVLNQPAHHRAWLLAHDTDDISPQALQVLNALTIRRLQGEPLAYLTGHKEFYGLDLRVDKRVLVPRPDTETLVDWALDVLKPLIDASVMQVSALDYSEDALTVARANAERLTLDVKFLQGAWLSRVQDRFSVIVSNPPYIAAQDEHLAALNHEPLQALASGDDGLDDIRQIITHAPAHLMSGGWLLLEHGYDQAAQVRGLLTESGFIEVQSRRDLSGIERCSGGRWR